MDVKQKIAFCLFGIIGGMQGKNGMGGDVDYIACADNYKNNIFKDNDVDVFIHTWSIQYKKNLTKIYNPKKSIFEEQIYFKTTEPYKEEKFRSYSRWYSTKQVLNLQKQFSDENKITYDFIMLSRFDIHWYNRINFNELEKNIFYISNWNEHKSVCDRSNCSFPEGKSKRYMDLWFIGNQEQMNYLSETYDVMDKIGNHELDQHKLVFDRMFFKYKDSIKFKYYVGNRFDYILYRRYLGATR